MIRKTVFLDSPTLTYLDNYLRQHDPDEICAVYYQGAIQPVQEEEQLYTFPGVVEIVWIEALDGYVLILTSAGQIPLPFLPITPFRIEIVPPRSKPSQPVYDIPAEKEWPELVAEILQASDIQDRPEARTRRELIDPVLSQRGWIEPMVKPEEAFRSVLDNTTRWPDYAFYISHTSASKPVLVAYLEAKHEGFPPEYGLEQARLYAEGRRAHIRWVFSSNGREFVQLDRLTQQRSGPYPLADFPTPADLRELYIPGRTIDTPMASELMHHTGRNPVVDRNDPRLAQDIVERLLDPAYRKQCLMVLGQSIRTAHVVGIASWSLTLEYNYIRLNISELEAFYIFRNYVRLVLDKEELTTQQRNVIEQYAILESAFYKKGPSALFCVFLLDNLESILPAFQPSHNSFIRKTAQRVKKRARYHASHSPGLVSYLRTATGINVPDPSYG